MKLAFDPLTQHETVVAGEAAGVVAGPENQVVSLGDHDQFLVFFIDFFKSNDIMR